MERKIVNVENLISSYNDKVIVDNISFSIKEKTINAFLCPNNSGKTTLIKTLSGAKYANRGTITVNNVTLSQNNYKKYIILISTILEDIENQFICEKVKDELVYPLKNLKYSKKRINKNVEEISSICDIANIIDKKIEKLSYIEKIKVIIASSIIHKPKVLFMDDIFRFLSMKEKKVLFKILKRIVDSLEITIIFTTSDINDIIGLKNIFVFNEGKILMRDDYGKIILKDNELSKMGFEIPLMIDLSRKLQFYDLLDGIYYDPNRVVDKLWK